MTNFKFPKVQMSTIPIGSSEIFVILYMNFFPSAANGLPTGLRNSKFGIQN